MEARHSYVSAPDVMVTYNDEKYHMVFDWGAKDFDWEHAYRAGLGYAEADKPEGPWVVGNKPIKVDTQFLHHPLLCRYWRMYAPMIIKRKKDWVLLYMMDTQPPVVGPRWHLLRIDLKGLTVTLRLFAMWK